MLGLRVGGGYKVTRRLTYPTSGFATPEPTLIQKNLPDLLCGRWLFFGAPPHIVSFLIAYCAAPGATLLCARASRIPLRPLVRGVTGFLVNGERRLPQRCGNLY